MSTEPNSPYFLVGDDSKTANYAHTDCNSCKSAGYCLRHPSIDKSKRDFLICRGDMGPRQRVRFMRAWDKQDKNAAACCPEGLYDRTMSFMKAMFKWTRSGFQTPPETSVKTRRSLCGKCPFNKENTCTVCSCDITAKTALSTESCPLGIWTSSFEPLHREIKAPRKHLLFHCYPTKKNEQKLIWHSKKLKHYLHLFDGVRSIGVSLDEAGHQKTVNTLPIERVKEIFDGTFQNWIVKINVPQKREGVTFLDLMDTVPQTNCDNDITFYCHGKGVRHEGGGTDAIHAWTETMYDVLLSHWPVVKNALDEAPMLGCFRQFNPFRLKNNHSWCYSGTYFWFKNKEVFERKTWAYLHDFFACVEAWPGNVFHAHEVSCMFHDNCKNMYDGSRWDLELLPLLQKREFALCMLDRYLE